MAMVSTTFWRGIWNKCEIATWKTCGRGTQFSFFSGIVLMKATPVFAFVCVQLIIDNMTSC